MILDPKTYTSARTIYIQTELFKLLKEIIKFSKKRQICFGYLSNLLFSRINSDFLIYDTLNKNFKKYTSHALNYEFTLHSLRHTHASLMFENGMTLEAISQRLGHKGNNITK
ncbi:MAG: site-specific integrase [Clostridiales bacterium]|nr:site-specific integrase [Clostridiales bacterium]MBS5878274.1 site-specific integrase [Clostridiales bacterium]